MLRAFSRSFLPLAAAVLLARLTAFAQVVPDEKSLRTQIEGSVTVGAGGSLQTGNRAAFQEHIQHAKDGFGGAEDLRFLRETKESTLVLEGHAMAGDGDYRFAGRWSRGEKMYLDFGYNRFRVFYNGAGRYFPRSGAFFSLYDEALHVDRSLLWVEVGLTPEDRPQLKLRYERRTRSGEKPSTELGETNLTGGAGSRSIVPSFISLDETRDLFTADLSREAESYRWAAGARYDHTAINNARENRRRPFEPQSRAVTSRDSSTSDLFSVHAFAEKSFGEKLRTSAGALFTTLDTNLGGSRIYGSNYDPIFDPLFASRQPGDLGFLDLAGGAELKQYVFNLNAVYQPTKNWVVQPALRFEHLHLDNMATYVASTVLSTVLATNLQNLEAQTQKQENKLTETIEVRYTGRASWTPVFRAEWFQATGNLDELQFDRTTSISNLRRQTDYTRVSQKYSIGANWYVRPRLTFSGEYYYKLRLNNYKSPVDSTPAGSNDRYPAFIADQDFATHDVNLRVSWRPASTLAFVTRYDLQYSTTLTTDDGLGAVRGGRLTTHIISQSATWSPLARLYFTSTVNFVYDQLATPAAAIILNSDNNYVNASFGGGYALDKATDLYFDYTYYRASDYTDNSATTLPYGADQRTQDASVTWVRRQSERLIYTVKYTYASNRDHASGGHNDYRAHVLYTKVQYKF